MAGRWRQSTIQIVMSAMPAVIYWVTGLTGRGDHMAISIGTLVAFTTLQQNLFRPAVQLLSVGVDIQSSLELFGRIFEYLDLPIDIAEPARPGDPGEDPRRGPPQRRGLQLRRAEFGKHRFD